MSKRAKCPTHKKDCHTHGSAIRAAIDYSRKRGVPLRAYFHRACGTWHITKTTKFNSGVVDTHITEGLSA